MNGKLFQEIESKENKLKELTAMARSNSVREEDVSRMNSEVSLKIPGLKISADLTLGNFMINVQPTVYMQH